MLTVNSLAVKELVATDEEQLHAARAVALEIFGDVRFFANANIDSHPGVFFLEPRIVADLPIVRERNRDFMSAGAQFVRRVHHVYERAGAQQRRSFGADH